MARKHRIAWILAACVALVIGAVWWMQSRVPMSSSPMSMAGAAKFPGTRPAGGTHATQTPTASGAGPPPGPESPSAEAAPDYHAMLRASDDYWAFAEGVLPAAKDGDAAAQYYLANALAYCNSLYDWYFVEHLPGGAVRHRTIDEALQFTATRPVFTPDDVRKLQSRCQRLRSTDKQPFGNARDWMDAAIQARYPVAQTVASLDKAMQVRQQPTPEASQVMRDDARSLALEALRTRDPEVIARIGEVAANLATGDYAESQKVPWVWRLAACLREPDCDSIADWLRLYCNIDTQCQPFETPVDVIRRKTGNDYDDIERRARELNEKIDAGTLEAGDI
jgi:hypothetical protein